MFIVREARQGLTVIDRAWWFHAEREGIAGVVVARRVRTCALPRWVRHLAGWVPASVAAYFAFTGAYYCYARHASPIAAQGAGDALLGTMIRLNGFDRLRVLHAILASAGVGPVARRVLIWGYFAWGSVWGRKIVFGAG